MSSGSDLPPMTRILHILTQPAEPIIDQLIHNQKASPVNEVVVVSLDQEAPDYQQLLHEVFQSDSIQCW
jgi:dTDP-glucose pyrophosphorylase